MVAVAVGLPIVGIVVLFNRLHAARDEVRAAWAHVDTQLRRRHDLVPELVSVARGVLRHERDVLDRLIAAGAAADAAAARPNASVPARAAAERDVAACLDALFAVVESTPRLRSDAHIALLIEDLTSTENRVALAGQHYNDRVRAYTTLCETFPASLVAAAFGFTRTDLFSAPRTRRGRP